MNLQMSGYLENHDHICIRWKVHCALNFVTSESKTVTFRKSEISLRLIQPSSIPLLIMQMKSNPQLDGIYDIEAFIFGKNSTKFHSKIKSVSFTTPHFEKLWSIDKKLLHSNKENLVTNDVITFVCIINCALYCCLGKELDVSQLPDSSLEKLSLDVSKLYKSKEHSDISLKCGDNTIPAHQFLLAARSDVFAAMFKSDMIECRERIIDIQDIELPILDHLLKYMYSGKVGEISVNTAMELYSAADKYDVCSLKQKCASIIFKELSIDNACDVLVLAHVHSDQDLKGHVLSYLQKNEEFLLSEQWGSFSKTHPYLAVEVYDSYIRGMSHK